MTRLSLFKRMLFFCIAFGCVLFLGAAVYLFLLFPRQPCFLPQTTYLYQLEYGKNGYKMLQELEKKQLITSWHAFLFRYWVIFRHSKTVLQAGEYALSAAFTPQQWMEKLAKGEVAQHAFTIIEGTTFAEILANLSKLPGLTHTLDNKTHGEIASWLGIAERLPEGVFFPDTYYYTANTTDCALLKRAYALMSLHLQQEWEKRDRKGVLKSPYEVLILASIIEKEASDFQERYSISGVFHKRLAKKMPLQADPTVLYGLQTTVTQKPVLTRAHLKQDTPHNTYLHRGLPATPIAAPSLQAIHAACHPEDTEALYFVATGDGKHIFSRTLQEHNRAVLEYQLRKEPAHE